MALSAFDDKSKMPNERTLSEILGRAGALWNNLKAHLSSEYEPVTEHWNFSGKNYGWGLRLKHKDRTVLYMTPCKGHLVVKSKKDMENVKKVAAIKMAD